MGGAMDLVTGARRVIVAMEHCTRDGQPRLLEKCTLPLTACGCVSMVVTELAVFTIESGRFQLRELMPGIDIDLVRSRTGAKFVVT
jgi:acetate CoA/acetoacetate CoA-transferase beta subunit